MASLRNKKRPRSVTIANSEEPSRLLLDKRAEKDAGLGHNVGGLALQDVLHEIAQNMLQLRMIAHVLLVLRFELILNKIQAASCDSLSPLVLFSHRQTFLSRYKDCSSRSFSIVI